MENNQMKCPVCNSRHIDAVTLPFYGIKHDTFEKGAEATVKLLQCCDCAHIFKLGHVYDLAEYMKKETYIKNVEKQKPDETRKNIIYERNKEQIKAIATSEILNTPDKKGFLDFGCNDGDFVGCVKDIYGDAFGEYYGCDLVKRNLFDKNSLGACYIDTLNKLDECCLQVINISHSLQYISNCKNLLKIMSKKLSNQGIIIVSVPNPRKPSIYLLEDQYHFFQINSLRKLFTAEGFNTYISERVYLKGELLMIASKQRVRIQSHFTKDTNKTFKELKISELDAYMRNIQEKIRIMGNNKATYILGRTSSAAFAYQCINESFKGSVDETLDAHEQQTFNKKKVLSTIDDVEGNARLIVPLYGQGEKIAIRLKEMRKDLEIKSFEC